MASKLNYTYKHTDGEEYRIQHDGTATASLFIYHIPPEGTVYAEEVTPQKYDEIIWTLGKNWSTGKAFQSELGRLTTLHHEIEHSKAEDPSIARRWEIYYQLKGSVVTHEDYIKSGVDEHGNHPIGTLQLIEAQEKGYGDVEFAATELTDDFTYEEMAWLAEKEMFWFTSLAKRQAVCNYFENHAELDDEDEPTKTVEATPFEKGGSI